MVGSSPPPLSGHRARPRYPWQPEAVLNPDPRPALKGRGCRWRLVNTACGLLGSGLGVCESFFWSGDRPPLPPQRSPAGAMAAAAESPDLSWGCRRWGRAGGARSLHGRLCAGCKVQLLRQVLELFCPGAPLSPVVVPLPGDDRCLAV